MPARKLDAAKGPDVRQFDVIGLNGGGSDFVSHVGLARDPLAGVTREMTIRLLHMQPPLAYSDQGSLAHSWGTAGLSPDEISKIQMFADELIGEFDEGHVSSLNQYAVLPRPETDQAPDTTTVHRKFSCATFVVAAYKQARIELLATEPSRLPTSSLETLKRAYADYAEALDRPRFRSERLKLLGDGPWPVLLPGHVLYALVRDEISIRTGGLYQAVLGDEYFPSQRSAPNVPVSVPGSKAKILGASKLKGESLVEDASDDESPNS